MTAPLQRNLPAHFYVDPGVYDAERQAIFRRSWQLLGPESQVAAPGDYLAVELAGWHLFVLRGRDGVLRGFHNLCRHRGARLLTEGQGRCSLLRCPYHNWVYDQQGRLQKAPWFGEHPDFRLEDWPLEPVSVASWRGLLFLAIAPEQELIEQLGDLPEELADHPLESYAAVATRRFVMAANWKTYTDNFVEGYHIPGIHPGFMRTIEFEGFETRVREGMIRMTAPQKAGSFYGGKWMWMWPSWTLSTFPGGMNTSRINPLGPERAELVYHFYFADSSAEGAEARQRTIEGNCAIVEEDFGICEETQRNYASGAYSPGPLSPRHEPAVAYFQQRVQASLAPEEWAAQ